MRPQGGQLKVAACGKARGTYRFALLGTGAQLEDLMAAARVEPARTAVGQRAQQSAVSELRILARRVDPIPEHIVRPAAEAVVEPLECSCRPSCGVSHEQSHDQQSQISKAR
jgi:hypothetical protein